MAAIHPRASIVNIARCPVHGLHGERSTCFAFEHDGERDCDGRVEQVPMVPLAEYEEVVEQRDRALAAAEAERRRPEPLIREPS